MTKSEITEMVLEGDTGEYSHLVIYCDHWDYTYGCRYVKNDEDVISVIENIKRKGSPGMFTIKEVYNYKLDLNKQLNETNAYHIEPHVQPKKVTNISDNLRKAIDYASKMHDGQQRHDGTPYIKHPLGVVENVLKFKKSKNLDTLLVSACLHDALEDTEVTYYDIVSEFGSEVAGIVLELTTDEDMKNILGKQQYLAIKMKNMSSWALIIKLCDRLDNVNDLVDEKDEAFKDKYINETIGIIDYLIKNRNLSKTHFIVIEQIIGLLFKLCEDDIEKKSKLAEISLKYFNIKTVTEYDQNIAGRLNELSNYVTECTKRLVSKKALS